VLPPSSLRSVRASACGPGARTAPGCCRSGCAPPGVLPGSPWRWGRSSATVCWLAATAAWRCLGVSGGPRPTAGRRGAACRSVTTLRAGHVV